jgi:Sec-independent protein secretion pathway component TatC
MGLLYEASIFVVRFVEQRQAENAVAPAALRLAWLSEPHRSDQVRSSHARYPVHPR